MAKQDVELQFKLIDGVSRGLAEIQKGVSGLGASLVKINAAADLTGKAFGALSSAAGAIGDIVVGAGAVEDALVRVSDITQATTEDQTALQDAITAAVGATRFSAEEAAGALGLLAEDGFSASEAVGQLGTVLQFAQANAQSAAQAAGGLGAILDTFGEKPAVIGQLADTLTAVARAAGTSTKALQEGLTGAGVAAEQAGLSVQETAGYLGLLASRGIEAGAGGKQLTKILQELVDPASSAGKAINDLGLSGESFGVVLAKLGQDSGAAEKVLAALGDRPRAALRALLEEGGGDLGKFTEVIANSAGASKEAADVLNNTFAGALARIRNQFDLTQKLFLTPILKPIAKEFELFSADLAKFAKSESFDKISQRFAEFVSAGAKSVGEFVRSFDFEAAAQSLSNFYDTSSRDLLALSEIITGVADAYRALREAQEFLTLDNSAVDFVDKQLAIKAEIDKVKIAFAEGKVEAQKFLETIIGTGKAAEFSAPVLDAFGLDLQRIGRNTKDAADASKDAAKQITLSTAAYRDLQAWLKNTVVQLEAAREAYKRAFDSGVGVDEAWADVKRLGTAVSDLRKQLDNAKLSADEVAKSFETLGIESQKALQESAQKAGDAFNTITEAAKLGQASQEDVNRAFEAYARRLADTATLADESTQRQIAQQIELAGRVAGVSEELIGVATSSLRAADVAEQSGERIARAFDGAGESAANVSTSIDDAAASSTTFGNVGVQAATAVTVANQRTAESYDAIGGRIDAVTQATVQQSRAALESALELNRGNEAVTASLREQLDALNGLTAARRQALELARQEQAAVEETLRLQAASVSGGIGGNNPQAAQPQQSASGVASRGDINVTINQNGVTPENLRQIVPQIERELSRLTNLRR